MIINLHNHTKFSDGKYAVEKVIRAAEKYELKLLGISDHYESGLTRCIKKSGLKNYIEHLESFKTPILKKGLEIYCGNGIPELDYSLINRLDYALFEFAENRLEEIAKIRNKIKIPIILAHPRISKLKNTQLLHKLGIIYELNMHYSKRFKNKKFFDKHKKLTYSLGTDTHKDLKRLKNVSTAQNFAKNKGLNLVSEEIFQNGFNAFG